MVGVLLHLGDETEEPWMLHIYDYDGKHHRVRAEAGTVFLFESFRYLQYTDTYTVDTCYCCIVITTNNTS